MNFTFHSLLDALKTELDARSGLSGVTVSTVPLGTDTPRQAITFDRVSQTDEPNTMGPTAVETYVLSGRIYVEKAGQGNTVGKAARDAAVSYLEELRDELLGDPTVGGTVEDCRLMSFDYESGVTDPPGRYCEITFDLEARHYG